MREKLLCWEQRSHKTILVQTNCFFVLPEYAVLRGHEAAVLSVAKLNETKIVSASSDATIRVWDLP